MLTIFRMLTSSLEAGVKRVVKLSALGCEEPERFLWAKEHLNAEHHFEKIGLPYTSIRPSVFHSNWFSYINTIKTQVRIIS